MSREAQSRGRGCAHVAAAADYVHSGSKSSRPKEQGGKTKIITIKEVVERPSSGGKYGGGDRDDDDDDDDDGVTFDGGGGGRY